MEQFLVGSSMLLWIVVLCNLLLTLALIRRINAGEVAQAKGGLKAGERAPDFTAETLGGEKVTLATYAQREVAFIFIAPSCNPCREALPRYDALKIKAAQSGVEIVLVSRGEREQTRALVEEFGIQLPVLIAPESRNPFMENYKLSMTPSYCLINRQGRVQSSGYPNLDGGIWKRFVTAKETSETKKASEVA